MLLPIDLPSTGNWKKLGTMAKYVELSNIFSNAEKDAFVEGAHKMRDLLESAGVQVQV